MFSCHCVQMSPSLPLELPAIVKPLPYGQLICPPPQVITCYPANSPPLPGLCKPLAPLLCQQGAFLSFLSSLFREGIWDRDVLKCLARSLVAVQCPQPPTQLLRPCHCAVILIAFLVSPQDLTIPESSTVKRMMTGTVAGFKWPPSVSEVI